MKTCTWFASVLGVALTLTSAAAVAAEPKAHVPQTEAAKARAELIARVQHAMNGYAAACAERNVDRLAEVTTSDVRMEYALDEPGTWLGADAMLLLDLCGSVGDSRMTNLWIFPTGHADTVFVQYEAPATAADPAAQQQLALVEMRGDRIARIVSFAETPPALLARIERAASDAGERGAALRRQGFR